MKLVAIHQPNFFPWLGYFDKIARSDVFIVLDSAQQPKTGGTWVNRVRLLVSGAATWVTVPIDRAYHGTRAVNEIAIRDDQPWRKRLLRTLEVSYGRAPFFEDVFALIRSLLEAESRSLAELNLNAIRAIVKLLGLGTELVLASTLPTEKRATERLIDLVRAVGGTAYLCGGGAGGYQEDELFPEAGLELVYQAFQPRPYPQVGSKTFVAGLSVIDALMNQGPEGTRRLLG